MSTLRLLGSTREKVCSVNISRKTFLAGSSAFAALGALSGCEKKAPEATSITFCLDYTPNTNHLGLYVAKKLGYYAEAGVDVSFVQPPDGGADAMVANGQAQFGISFQDWMASYLGSDSPLPVTAVAAIIQHNTSGIMSPLAKHITQPRDMDNTRYGTLDVKTEQAIIRELVNDDGGDFNTIQLVSANTTDEVSGLQADLFDSVWVFAGWALQNAHVQDYPVNYFSIAEQNSAFDYYTPVIIANNSYLENSPELARAFLQATKRGYTYARDHDEEAAKLLLEEVPELDSELVYTSARYLAPRFQGDARAWGVFDKERWNTFYTWMNAHNLTEKPIPLSTAFTNEYLDD